ncbi:MAG: TIGR00730 family Rossman fold protein [Muribaculaceae bacterium]|nr:TIGR00730 family Rossman fold protein [Muribaculaceae bacterium]
MNDAITVYCASATNLPDVYIAAAQQLGSVIAKKGLTLITGAGRTGLMGAIADAALANGGKVVGIIPQFMVERSWNHTGLSQILTVKSMHERKATMAAMSRAAIALPGGIGTFEELTEIITWRQLGLFSGNIVIYNVNDYYAPLLQMLDKAIDEGFMRPDHRKLFSVVSTAEEAVEAALDNNAQQSFSPKF